MPSQISGRLLTAPFEITGQSGEWQDTGFCIPYQFQPSPAVRVFSTNIFTNIRSDLYVVPWDAGSWITTKLVYYDDVEGVSEISHTETLCIFVKPGQEGGQNHSGSSYLLHVSLPANAQRVEIRLYAARFGKEENFVLSRIESDLNGRSVMTTTNLNPFS